MDNRIQTRGFEELDCFIGSALDSPISCTRKVSANERYKGVTAL